MSNISAMQQKTINFNNWICDFLQHNAPDCQEKQKFMEKFRNYFQDEKNYNDFMFSSVPMLCTAARNQIERIRNLKDGEARKEALENMKMKLELIQQFIQTILSIDANELDQFVLKLSLYVSLFTDIYFVDKTQTINH